MGVKTKVRTTLIETGDIIRILLMILLYLVFWYLIWFVVNLLFLNKRIRFKKGECGTLFWFTAFIFILSIFGMGIWRAAHPVIKSYDLTVNKKAGRISSLNIAMVADVHMGIFIKEKGIDYMINAINRLKPDIIFFCGDMTDESTPEKLKEYYGNAFKNLKSKYGTYYVTGNHEYSENVNETIKYMKKGNVIVLQNKAVEIDDSFYVVGRNDDAGNEKKSLESIMKGMDKSLPIIYLTHRPENIDEAENKNIDLQLSGHTHDGQYFPNNILIKFIYRYDYGYIRKDNFQLVVTSGYGVWGPPVRIGTKSEIVHIMLNFKSTSK